MHTFRQMGRTIQFSGFPHLIDAEVVKEFLEQCTGPGTVFALEVKPFMRRGSISRAYAIVQFTDSTYAETIVNQANDRRLSYGSCYLKAKQRIMDIIPYPVTFVHEVEGVTLNFGCQTSKEKFSVLWRSGANVSVKFGTGLKKIDFLLRHDSVEYQLQLSYQSIWQVVLYNIPAGHETANELLVIQLFGAPRIYEVDVDDSIYSYFKQTPDEQLVRTIDFTPSSCIGQSSGLCLQLPDGMRLPNFGNDNFIYYKKSETRLVLEDGIPYSENQSLVPIIQPPREFELPYGILFKVCSLVQTGCIPGPNLDSNFFKLVNPQQFDIRYIEPALEKLYSLKECCYDPVSWLIEQYHKYRTLTERPKPPTVRSREHDLVYVRSVQVTPTKLYFSGPELNVSNRVLRQFYSHIDNFLRVSFVDEEGDKMHSTDLLPRVATGEDKNRRLTKIYERILSTLRNGIRIGDKKFEFLAFSSSQLRENSMWMFASTTDLNADIIRQWMGDFSSIRNVAKYAARLGQSFGSSTETLGVDDHEFEEIPDIVAVSGGREYIFSDGIGKISAGFARTVAKKCGVRKNFPSAFQIRYGGYKGVVAVDPTSPMKLSLRPSMLKYQSDNKKLDVLAWSKYQPCFLNRQIITLLSSLGVRDSIFLKKQREAVAQLHDILVDPVKAQEALGLMTFGENTRILKEMLKCGYMPDKEPFLSMMLQTFRSSRLLDLRLKARIFVRQARQMMGCLDETGTLEYGQVFVQYSGAGFCQRPPMFHGYRSTRGNFILKGKVVVAKNPCLHPGDVRVLEAVDVPALHHMVDCIVFPSKGMRPHPNECSGSDLDGDVYFVSWDPDLIPPGQVSPMDYDPAPSMLLDHEVTIEEVEEYFTNYIMNDSLGILAIAHTVFADREPEKAFSEPCLELAKLFSIAVDFPKTGIPAEIPSRLRVKEYPDFMEKPEKPTYDSRRIIGKLYRKVKDSAPDTISFRSFTKEMARKSYDTDMEVNGFEKYIDEAFDYKTGYDYKLGNLMDYYGIKTEAEILCGGNMKLSKTFDRRKDTEAISAAVRSLRNEARSWFKKGSESADVYAKASAWYHVTYHPDFWGRYNKGLNRDHYLSFPWCVCDPLVHIKKDNSRRANDASSLVMPFRRDLILR